MNSESKSPLKKTPLTAKCKTSIDPMNPLLSEYFSLTDRNESSINTAVKNRSKRDIPDIPKVKLIPYDLIQSIVWILTNEPFDWEFVKRYRHKPNGMILKNIAIGLKSSDLLFGIVKMTKEPIRGNNMRV